MGLSEGLCVCVRVCRRGSVWYICEVTALSAVGHDVSQFPQTWGTGKVTCSSGGGRAAGGGGKPVHMGPSGQSPWHWYHWPGI